MPQVEKIDALTASLPVFVPPDTPALKALQAAIADGSSPPDDARLVALHLAGCVSEYDASLALIGRINGVFRQARLMRLVARWGAAAAAGPFEYPQYYADRDAIRQAMRQEPPETARFTPLYASQAEYYARKLAELHNVAKAAAESIALVWPAARIWFDLPAVKQVMLTMDTCEDCNGPLLPPDQPCRLCAIHSFL